MEVIRVVDWSALYENHRTRELKRMEWIPVPNRMDGDGYTELVDDPNGAAHLGVWLCILQIASKCDPRGTLVRGGGVAHTPRSIARISRLPAQLCDEAIARLVGIGWLEVLDYNHPSGNEMRETGGNSRFSGDNPATSRASARLSGYGMEWKGTEGKRMEGKRMEGTERAALSVDDFFAEQFSLHPVKSEKDRARQMMGDIPGIKTGGIQELFRLGHTRWIGDGCQYDLGDDYGPVQDFADFVFRRVWHAYITGEEFNFVDSTSAGPDAIRSGHSHTVR